VPDFSPQIPALDVSDGAASGRQFARGSYIKEMEPKHTADQLGICATCDHMEYCTSKKTWVGQVFHCEEFDNSGTASSDRALEVQAITKDESTDFTTREKVQTNDGICVNCNAREHCGYRTSKGVVWYCEEYHVAPLPMLIPDTLLPPFGLKRPVTAEEEAEAKKPHPELEADDIDAILKRQGTEPGGLIAILEEIQSVVGYLPEKAIRLVSEKTGRSMVDLYGIATFFRYFSLKPRGRHTISVCQGTACHVRGAPTLVDEFKRQLDVIPGETTVDGVFTLETVNCLGACALGPIVVGADQYFSRVETPEVKGILKKVQGKSRAPDVKNDPRFFQVAVNCSLCSKSLMDPDHLIDGHPSIQITATYKGKQGRARFSSLYGSFAAEYEGDIPVDAATDFSCPHCGGVLGGDASCPECEYPMAVMLAEGGGLVHICTRRNCKGHSLDLTLDYF